MDGFVDRSRGGVTELRIHGVSGTPPGESLNDPNVMCVSGDSTAGFYRRVWLGGRPPAALPYADVPAGEEASGRVPFRREAYSWGGLTSGSGSRALWMLLLPFMLANVAFWMYPVARRPGQQGSRPLRELSAIFQRLFSLSLTVTLIMAAVAISTDLAGWQCGGSSACLAKHGFLHFLSLSFFQPPGHRLAVATLLPLAVVALLWVLGHKSWNNYERIQVPAMDQVSPPPIGDRRMWNGAEPVRRLRSLHVSTGFAASGIFLLAPLTSGADTPERAAAIALLVLLLAAVTGTLVALLVPSLWRRERPGTQEPPASGGMLKSRGVDQWTLFPWLTLLVVIAGGALVLFSHAGPVFATGPLPWFSGTFGGILLAQIVLVAAIATVLGVAAQASRGERDSGSDQLADGTRLPYRRALGGLVGPLLMLLSWMLAAGFTAGLVLRVADYLGTPAVAGGPRVGPEALLVPSSLYWVAAGAFCFLVVTALVAVAVVGWAWLRPAQQALVKRAYREADQAASGSIASQRARAIARVWTRASLTDQAPRLLGIMAGVLVAATVVGIVGYLPGAAVSGREVRGIWLWQHAAWLATAGSWAIGALAVALIALGRAAYSNDHTRRTVGILWDLGTFWPRATHPLAPPCYSERTMPDLINRSAWLAPDDADLVVLSAHSQGAVIAAALVLQLDRQEQSRTALLTYGNPVARLYSRYFPAYFGPPVIGQAGQVRATNAPGHPDRSRWSWRNLYRASDPIGGPVFRDYPAQEDLYQQAPGTSDGAAEIAGGPPRGDNMDVDRQFLDPRFSPAPGDTADPPILGHSGYFDDPYFWPCLEQVIELARGPHYRPSLLTRPAAAGVTLPADGAGGAGPGP
jgi:hypothetical protein